ncbi:hypothetical protein F7725_028963 [Dissostichus mawsoni]|uniref:Uncharacterized protein n=1 Tax=Dissostichus mawsoni TaxID=36200 RepID=A0A7J5XH51_DISMA|nr:hypothetical protein F7725_028963 [Dissostichus mawsoni]
MSSSFKVWNKNPREETSTAKAAVSVWSDLQRHLEGHEEDLAASSRAHRGEENLQGGEELQSLSSLVHENSIEVSRLHGADLNGLLSPAHDLVGVDHHVFGDASVGVDVDALVLVAQQHPMPSVLGSTTMACGSCTEDLRVEAFLVFADLGRVAVRPDVGRVNIDYGDLSGLVEPRLLLLLLHKLDHSHDPRYVADGHGPITRPPLPLLILAAVGVFARGGVVGHFDWGAARLLALTELPQLFGQSRQVLQEKHKI